MLCNKLPPNLAACNNKHLFSLTASQGQEAGSCLRGRGSGSPSPTAGRLLAAAAVQGLTGTRQSSSKLTLAGLSSSLAVVRGLPFYSRYFFTGGLNALMTQQLVSPRMSDLRKERKPKRKMPLFMCPLGNAKLSVLPWSLVSQSIPSATGRGLRSV